MLGIVAWGSTHGKNVATSKIHNLWLLGLGVVGAGLVVDYAVLAYDTAPRTAPAQQFVLNIGGAF